MIWTSFKAAKLRDLNQAQRSIISQATAESNAMQGDNNNLSISIGGNATGNRFQSGDRRHRGSGSDRSPQADLR